MKPTSIQKQRCFDSSRPATDDCDRSSLTVVFRILELPLTPQLRVYSALDMPEVHYFLEAAQASNAFAYGLSLSRSGLIAPFGIGQMTTCHSDKVTATIHK